MIFIEKDRKMKFQKTGKKSQIIKLIKMDRNKKIEDEKIKNRKINKEIPCF